MRQLRAEAPPLSHSDAETATQHCRLGKERAQPDASSMHTGANPDCTPEEWLPCDKCAAGGLCTGCFFTACTHMAQHTDQSGAAGPSTNDSGQATAQFARCAPTHLPPTPPAQYGTHLLGVFCIYLNDGGRGVRR